LMRTNAAELRKLGRMMAERLNQATGPFVVLVPTRGFSEHTKRMTHDLTGNEIGPWSQPAVDAEFVKSLRESLIEGQVEELDLHINDPAFAEACARCFLALMSGDTEVQVGK
ncbi:MAG TPA: Tm-1-like ATP-binding domain-containing protein, partial [Gammaproteobacteria bacterium]|nr:Tm-1-like ATP-binding domain-containing protein [Gammaproteobacteria bacterium]